MIVCHKHKFIFVHIHKCAGTSITSAIKPYLAKSDMLQGKSVPEQDSACQSLHSELHKHSTAAEIRKFIGEPVWNSYFTFAFVRHPLDRLISFYEFLNRVHENSLHQLGLGQDVLDDQTEANLLSRYPNRIPWTWPGMKAFITTDDFSGFLRSEFLKQEQGVNPMSRALTDKAVRLLVDFVGKFENLEADWKVVCDHIRIFEELPKENHSERRFKRNEKYWTKADLDYASHCYESDFDLFSYSASSN